MSTKMVCAVLLFSPLMVSAAIAQTSKVPRTKSITIGNFEYLGSSIQTSGSGTSEVVSLYKLNLDSTAITVAPITFANVSFMVKGSSLSSQQGGFPVITTGPGCGVPGVSAPCSLLAQGGGEGFLLQPCAKLAADQTLTQDCVSIALQLVSPTGKNFSLQLADGETFCTSGITNIFVLAPDNKVAVDPQCDVNNFCKGASVPVILRGLPIQNCQ
jgi:hypothetical protein